MNEILMYLKTVVHDLQTNYLTSYEALQNRRFELGQIKTCCDLLSKEYKITISMTIKPKLTFYINYKPVDFDMLMKILKVLKCK